MIALNILIFPGILFTVIVALLLAGLDRKVLAHMQKRVGPPIIQPLYDFLKLCGKETIVPAAANRGLPGSTDSKRDSAALHGTFHSCGRNVCHFHRSGPDNNTLSPYNPGGMPDRGRKRLRIPIRRGGNLA